MFPSDNQVPYPKVPQPDGSPNAAVTPLSAQNPLHNIYAVGQAGGNLDQAAPFADTSTPNAAQPLSPATPSIPHSIPTATASDSEIQDDSSEWIERVKSVVNQTMNDPYGRMQALRELQATYQRKHFGKETGRVQGS